MGHAGRQESGHGPGRNKIEHLPANIRPDSIARQALNGFTMTRQEAISRAAQLRAISVTDDHFIRPGEDLAAILQVISQTDDYRDYHKLLDIERAVTDLAPVVDLIADTGLTAETRAWLSALPDLRPFPTELSGSS